jgi:glyoxylase-like metal-dependent hydrolase (beta-lactamase superfamily II)
VVEGGEARRATTGHGRAMMEAEITRDLHAVDLWEGGRPHRTSGYVITTPRPALVDPGSARSLRVWPGALAALGIAPADVAYVVLTHIHLDHAGGVGLLLHRLPAARIVVHRRGARHLVDPSRLIDGARRVFGERLDSDFGVPEPVPQDRLLVPTGQEEIDLGGGHRLRFLDAFGHARHQHMILDAGAGCLFSGDELGGRFPDLAGDYVIPDTAPNQFDPEAMLRSADLLSALRPEAVLFSHFGRCPLDADALRALLAAQVHAFVAAGRRDDRPATWDEVHAALLALVRRDLERRGVSWTPEAEEEVDAHLTVAAQGIVDYYDRRARQTGQ